MKNNISHLTDGILFEQFSKVRDNFYDKIDENIHTATYIGEHKLSYAEPEYTGKFMDICAYFYEREGDIRALKKGMAVVDSIEKNIRADGYIGMLGEGNELKMFSVWNQAFTLYGLCKMYEAVGDKRIEKLIIKAADWIVNTFSGEKLLNILDAMNDGTQHITSLYPMLCAYEVTKNEKYIDFVGQVIQYCENTDMNLISFDSILNIRSKKGIEMLVIYLAVLKYGLIKNDKQIINAAERYFEEIRSTQIRNTGNGTIHEVWTENGNAPRLMPTETKPNETCVAVGIVELALALFYAFPKAEYLDVIEKTLFNHMCGSLEKSGSDFAYYQGNYGRKIYRTASGAYQSCRYRGFTLFSYLNDILYYYDEKQFIPMIYASSTFEYDGIKCIQTTDYPKTGKINFEIQAEHPITVKLRVPNWCESYSLTIDENKIEKAAENGYLVIDIAKGKSNIVLSLEEKPVIKAHEIDAKPYLSVHYGPLLMAHDTHFGGELWQPLSIKANFIKVNSGNEAMVRLESDEMTLVDFAFAGGNSPETDLYTVFIPQK